MNKKSLFKWLPFLLALFLLLSACQTADNPEPGDPAEQAPVSEEVEQTEDAQQLAEPYTVIDGIGREVTFEQVPETIISLQPSNTEILFALGFGDQIIGATEYDHYPEEAKNIPRVSDSVNFNAEQIISMNPDVVFAYTIGDPESIKPLENAGIPVFVIQSAASFEDVYADIVRMAEVMGVKEKGEALVREIQEQLAEVESKLADIEQRKQVYLEISPAPELFSTGNGTFLAEVLQRAGVENIFGEQEGWIMITEEEVISRNPDLIATTVNYIEDPVGEILARSGWDGLSALQQGHVYLLDGDMMSRPGPRIGMAVEHLAQLAYPELFE
jgi:iron complex transport system substrate-binding protein